MSFDTVAGWFAVVRALVFPGELPLISTVGTIIAFEVLGVAVWMTGSHFGIPAVVPKAQAAVLAFAGVVAAVLIWVTLGSHGLALDAPVDLGSTVLRGLLLLAIVVWFWTVVSVLRDVVVAHRSARADPDGAVDAALWPGAMVYTEGARFRVRDRDDRGDSIPVFARGRTGTVVTVEGPVALNCGFHGLDVVVEMIYLVHYDDERGVDTRLSHLWMEPLPDPARRTTGDTSQANARTR
ncbi:hypothetical protein [Mycobacteroides abscessus]|uniref:hypothetical protein n=1 Tax=Mycobacteroides abscessus TaxID=36809 RepID=UPI000C25924D|nr:hypothetical protein [Mycobacteroides abscessus]